MPFNPMHWWWPVETKPAIRQQIIEVLRARVAQCLAADAETLPCLSPCELLNVLFLMNGHWGSLGDYLTTLRTLRALLGDSVWAKPETATEDPHVSTLVQ